MPPHIIDWPAQSCVIPLDQAWFCESCSAITNDPTCSSCASEEHSQRLALWLDREREPIRVPQTGVFLTVIPASKKLPEKRPAPRRPNKRQASLAGRYRQPLRFARSHRSPIIVGWSRRQDVHHPMSPG